MSQMGFPGDRARSRNVTWQKGTLNRLFCREKVFVPKTSLDKSIILGIIPILGLNSLPGSKNPQKGSRKVFNVWAKPHFSNFDVGRRPFPCSRKCLSVVLK